MKPSLALQAHRDDIRRVVEAHHARNARVFGSVAHGDDTDDSDLDILIDPHPDDFVEDGLAARLDRVLTLADGILAERRAAAA